MSIRAGSEDCLYGPADLDIQRASGELVLIGRHYGAIAAILLF